MRVIFKLSLKLPQPQGPCPALKSPGEDAWYPYLLLSSKSRGSGGQIRLKSCQGAGFMEGVKVREEGKMASQSSAALLTALGRRGGH